MAPLCNQEIMASSSDEESNTFNTPPAPPTQPLPLPRPQVGMKTPKSSFPPLKCINVHCKEEKRELKSEIASLKQQIEDCKYIVLT